MAKTHRVAAKTIWRVLKALEVEGLVVSKPRRGFRVLAKANDPERGHPIAYVGERPEAAGRWDAFQRPLVGCLQDAASHRGWSLLAIKPGDFTAGQLVDRLSCVRTFGAIVDSPRPETLKAIRDAGIPCLMVDAWVPDAGVDAVLQDGHMGGILAANYLLERGFKKIAWFGVSGNDYHALDRMGGALAALAAANPGITPEFCFAPEGGDLEGEAFRLLSRPNRPEAVLALWQDFAIAVKRAADRLGLVLGRDLELVGWCAEEMVEGFYRPAFGAGPVPPTVTWNIQTMADAAVSRLAERRDHPSLPPLQIKIPVRLRTAMQARSAGWTAEADRGQRHDEPLSGSAEGKA
jgi:DNA-binding LacI/PurR family transcriptional regulator